MTNQIKSFNNRNRELIFQRSINPKLYVRTLHLNQTDGNFVATCPIDNKIMLYGQSPNNSTSWFKTNRSISKLGSFGYFSFPTDAKFDFLRRKIWVADTGNKRILSIDYDSLKPNFELLNFNFPTAIAVNQENGDIFVRDFQDLEHGIIYWIKNGGVIEDKIIFKDIFVNKSFIVVKNKLESYNLPSPSMMDFDNSRQKLWWITKSTSYMADLNCMQLSSLKIADNLNDNAVSATSIELEHKTGNAIIGSNPPAGRLNNKKFSKITYLNKNNYNIMYSMNLPDSILTNNPLIQTQPVGWPIKLEFFNFNNVLMNGEWSLFGEYRGQIKSYLSKNNTLSYSVANPNGRYGIGTYMPFGTGFQWKFIFYIIENYPIIKQKWIYIKESRGKSVFGNYILQSYYSYGNLITNPYLNDKGTVKLG